ncbi:keratin, type I cytoskeletal 50 kDa-like [Oncorhynchus tshawytscha]|uniref:keratin, type I cytoskeletal 50 kDa-like n=1 Tax=Oncorhynchus tshawytscha TaxID=74940 RepID=UPI001C3CF140|nr:keratin, type I cytoskeletal 50 kDa-like [Oncorhynchus tshawytscha]
MEFVGREEDFDPVAQQLASSEDEGRADENEAADQRPVEPEVTVIQILLASRSNTKTVLDIDNAKLASEDFKMNYAKEQAMRMAVEADISGLRRVLDDMNLGRSDLEMQYEGLKDELIMLKRSHQVVTDCSGPTVIHSTTTLYSTGELQATVGCYGYYLRLRPLTFDLQEIALVKTHVGSQVNVSVDAAPSQDLNAAMTEIRKHYESVAIKNRKELEAWYQGKLATVEIEVMTNNEQLKSSLEPTLADTQKRYSAQLAGLQSMVTSLELQLSQLHANIAHNKQEYDMFLNLKTRLELEIAENRRLLDGEDDSSTQGVTKMITVTQTIVDGKVMVLLTEPSIKIMWLNENGLCGFTCFRYMNAL